MNEKPIGSVPLMESSLSFLGMGVPPPFPTWGGMLSSTGRTFLQDAPWLAVFPGIAISLTVLAFNLMGDGLRDAFDPRHRGVTGDGGWVMGDGCQGVGENDEAKGEGQ